MIDKSQRKFKYSKSNVKTLPHPGFPQITPSHSVPLCLASISTITEGVWDSRFQYIEELKRMGKY